MKNLPNDSDGQVDCFGLVPVVIRASENRFKFFGSEYTP